MMLKFIRGRHGQGLKPIHESFTLQKTPPQGYPKKPTTLAYDSERNLLAIGTRDGGLRIVGSPNFQLSAHHFVETPVLKIVFTPFHIFTLCEKNRLHLWEIREPSLVLLKSLDLDGKLKTISSVTSTENVAYIGTEGGNIYTLDLESFTISDSVIYSEAVTEGALSKVSPGAVESILINDTTLILGYERGLIVIWDLVEHKPVKHFSHAQHLESLSFHECILTSSHNDGSYVIWDMSSDEKTVKIPYGPFPCKKISKIRAFDDLVVFSGGMPRAEFGERFTVSAIQSSKNHVAFELTSKIVDFEVIHDGSEPVALVICAEEELVVIDLRLEDWPVMSMPYLNCLHPSAVTCLVYSDESVGKTWQENWPLGTSSNIKSHSTIITGHEDGSVRFWDSHLRLISKYTTNDIFSHDELLDNGDGGDEEEWPPFRKVGVFDPYTDDPRLAVKKIWYSKGILAIGGTAGQVVVIDTQGSSEKVEPTMCNLTPPEFTWKGHSPLTYTPNTSMKALLQIHPPAAITAMDCSGDLIAVGTAHGLCVFDFNAKAVVLVKSTLGGELLAAGEGPISRRKSIKKSLRESFRRLRKGRSGVATNSNAPVKSVERAVEARSPELSGMIRTVTFSQGNLISHTTPSRLLMAGTAAGTVFLYTITNSIRIAKEIQLKHGAPVLSVIVIDSNSNPIHSQSSPPHKLLITSEEQIKVFSLPNLRPLGKLKVTAHEGVRVRKVGVIGDTLLVLYNSGDIGVLGIRDMRRLGKGECCRNGDISGMSSLVFTPSGALFMSSCSELEGIRMITGGVAELALPEEGDITIDEVVDHTGGGTEICSPSGVGEPQRRDLQQQQNMRLTPEPGETLIE